jgi:predicted O-methyltransferase YrrM
MEELLPRVERAFEYGSGGSTVFLCQRVKELVSIEHDPDWAEAVRRRIAAIGCSVTLECRPPTIDPSDELYRSTDSRYEGRSFREYASSIDSYPDGYFDLVLIDGRARVACFGHAERKIRAGGWLIFDNSDLAEYQAVNEQGRLRGWTAREIDGPGPYSAAFWRTTIWTTPAPGATN